MKKVIWGIYFLTLLILIMTLLEFVYLDKKMTRAIYEQMEHNAKVSVILEEQAKCIRVLSSDCLVLTNIVTSGEYCSTE